MVRKSFLYRSVIVLRQYAIDASMSYIYRFALLLLEVPDIELIFAENRDTIWKFRIREELCYGAKKNRIFYPWRSA